MTMSTKSEKHPRRCRLRAIRRAWDHKGKWHGKQCSKSLPTTVNISFISNVRSCLTATLDLHNLAVFLLRYVMSRASGIFNAAINGWLSPDLEIVLHKHGGEVMSSPCAALFSQLTANNSWRHRQMICNQLIAVAKLEQWKKFCLPDVDSSSAPDITRNSSLVFLLLTWCYFIRSVIVCTAVLAFVSVYVFSSSLFYF